MYIFAIATAFAAGLSVAQPAGAETVPGVRAARDSPRNEAPDSTAALLGTLVKFAETASRNWNFEGHQVDDRFTARHGNWDYAETTYEPWLFGRAEALDRIAEDIASGSPKESLLAVLDRQRCRVANIAFVQKMLYDGPAARLVDMEIPIRRLVPLNFNQFRVSPTAGFPPASTCAGSSWKVARRPPLPAHRRTLEQRPSTCVSGRYPRPNRDPADAERLRRICSRVRRYGGGDSRRLPAPEVADSGDAVGHASCRPSGRSDQSSQDLWRILK